MAPQAPAVAGPLRPVRSGPPEIPHSKSVPISLCPQSRRCGISPLVAPQAPAANWVSSLDAVGPFSAQMVYDPNRGVLSGIWDAPQVPAAPSSSPTRRRSRGHSAETKCCVLDHGDRRNRVAGCRVWLTPCLPRAGNGVRNAVFARVAKVS